MAAAVLQPSGPSTKCGVSNHKPARPVASVAAVQGVVGQAAGTQLSGGKRQQPSTPAESPFKLITQRDAPLQPVWFNNMTVFGLSGMTGLLQPGPPAPPPGAPLEERRKKEYAMGVG